MSDNDQSSAPTAAYYPGVEKESGDSSRTILSESSHQSGRTGLAESVPGYELLKELGRGGMGVVYLARQRSLNRMVALKMVLSGCHAAPQDLARFRTEAEAVAQLQHPHIVQIFETGEHDRNPWYSMEYVAGGSLEKRLHGRPLPPLEAARVTAMLAEAIAHAHARGVLHRDLKPANILIQEVEHLTVAGDSTQRTHRSNAKTHNLVLDPVPAPSDETVANSKQVTFKITDFGLAKQFQDGAAISGSRTQAGTVLGSPSYMAPEQASGENNNIGPAVDIYALGAILYELLTGRPPFRASTAWDTIMLVLHDEPVPPTRLQPKLPRDLETICLKCLAKDPKKRYASAADLAEDLQRFLDDEPILARPIPWWERATKAAKRHPMFTALLGTAFLAAAAIVSLVLVGNARLQKERDIAEIARTKAEREHLRAQKRLSKAVEAVEQLLTKTASENWARRPELQEERKKLLEEAVKFYQTFLEQEADEPLLRRETARAYFRMAGVYLLMGENHQAEDALQRAKKLQEALCEEFPHEPEYQHELVKTINFLGNAEVLQGHYESSLSTYEKAAKKAEVLAEAFPENPEFKVTQVQTYMSLGQYYSGFNPQKAEAYQQLAHDTAKSLFERNPQPYANQLYYAATMLIMAQYRVNNNRTAEAEPYLQGVKPLLDALGQQQAPTAMLRDHFDLYRSMYAIIHGAYLVRSNKQDAGEAELKRGVGLLDELLVQRPKMFPYRVLQVNALNNLSDVQNRQRKGEAKQTFERTIKIQDQLVKDLPQMPWLKWQSLNQRSMFLVLRAREGDLAAWEKELSALQKSPEIMIPQAADARYNIACAYAQASKHSQGDARERYAAEAVKRLVQLIQTNYFRSPRVANHLDKDDDLDPLRDRADFQDFLKQVKQKPARQ